MKRIFTPITRFVFLLLFVSFIFYLYKSHLPLVKATSNHGIPGDLWSDVVIGQINFNQSGPDQVVPFKVFNPGGVIVDRGNHPNTIYVYDGGNSRILVHTSLGICANNPAVKCTAHSDCPNSQCSFTPSKPADLVIGQPSGTSYNGCNGDANMQNYPLRSPASDSTLCSIPEYQPSPMEGGSFANMAIDNNHNLFVTDFFNNRVLKYADPVHTDTIADNVWGQDDMTGNKCNKADPDIPTAADPPNPTASSLCMGRNTQYQKSFVAGVEIDPSGNLWVADSSNHRVLRFTKTNGLISETADLVLGQSSFTTRQPASGSAQMDQPAALRIDPATGWLYVADKANNRVSIFRPPFTNGMAASAIFGSQFQGPASIDFDPSGSGIWISDNLNGMLELWNMAGTTVQKVLFKDTYQPNGLCLSTSVPLSCKNPQPGGCWYRVCDARGSVGIDSDGNVLVSGAASTQDVFRFAAPISTPELGRVISADHRMMYPPPDGFNLSTDKGLYAPRSVVVKNNQLIISDGRLVRFWNNPANITDGQSASGYIKPNPFVNLDPWTIQRIAADNQNHLWVAQGTSVDVYQLPLTQNAMPIKNVLSSTFGLPVVGGGWLTWNYNSDQFWGMDVDPSGNYLWLTQVEPVNRVIRVRDPFTSPRADVVLGQLNPTGTACNRGLPAAQNDTVCYPGAVKLDKLGNVWVSDNSLEIAGNFRMLMFNASLFANITTTALFAPPATLVSPLMIPWEPAFDSHNRMVVGYNAYGAQNSPTELSRFPGIYNNPIQSLATSAFPDMYLKDLFSQAYGATFDDQDNLYIADLNRGRVLIYKTIPPAPTPTPTPVPNTPPTITTDSLPIGYFSEQRPFGIIATDPDVTDDLTATISGLPPRLEVGSCLQSTPSYKKLTCIISNAPTRLGTFPITISVSDSANNTTTKILDLVIRAFH